MSAASSLLGGISANLRLAWVGSPLPRFLTWWMSELAACLPARIRNWLTRGPKWLLLDMDCDTLHIWEEGAPTPKTSVDLKDPLELKRAVVRGACAGIPPPDLRLSLCLPAAHTLRRRMFLPAAAGQRLRQVLAFEMDRQTPFRLVDVHFDQRVIGGGPDGHTLVVELGLTQRSFLDRRIAQMQELGVILDAVDIWGANRSPLGFNLLPAEHRRARRHARRSINAALTALAAMLLLAGMWQSVTNRGRVLTGMRTEVETLRIDAEKVANLRSKISESEASLDFIEARIHTAPSMLALVADLSRRLPHTVWLEHLTLDQEGTIGLQGQAGQATVLLGLLKDSPLLVNPSFEGAIQTDARTGKERFHIVAKWRRPLVSAHAPR